MPLLVSVVIPSYNCADFIGATLESIFAQTYRPIEVIVVDDGSADGTGQIIRRFPDVLYVVQPNGGPARARNVGIQRSSGAYIAFQDADDLWTPDKLATQASILDSDPQIGLVFGDMRNFLTVDDRDPTMFEKYSLGEGFFGDRRLVLGAVEKLMGMNFIPTGTVLARKDALVAVGQFDESFRCAEDWDLWLRIALRYRIAYTPKLVMLRRIHGSNTSKGTEAMSIAALKVLEKLKNEKGDMVTHASATVGNHLRDGYRNLGYFYLRQLALKQARSAFIRSLSFGIHWRALVYLASTFLGTGLVRSMMRARG